MNGHHVAVLAAIASFHKANGYAPTLRELMALTGTSSTSVMRYRLNALRAAGHVAFEDNKTRTIRLNTASPA